jgi:hypothetical protein
MYAFVRQSVQYGNTDLHVYILLFIYRFNLFVCLYLINIFDDVYLYDRCHALFVPKTGLVLAVVDVSSRTLIVQCWNAFH